MGGKTRTDADGKVTKGWDHDPPAKEKLVPFGILMVATGALMLLFGSHETSDAWVDALQMWWLQVRSGLGHIKRLVIYLDNGPKNSGRRTQFLKRMVAVRRLVGVGDPAGVLSSVPQQVQPDRTLLVGAGEEVERRVTELPEGGPAMRPADDLEGPASDRETPPRRVSRRRSSRRQGDEAVRGSTGTIGDPAEVRHHHQTENRPSRR